MLRRRHRSPGRIKEEAHQRQKRLKDLAVKFVHFLSDQKRIPLFPIPKQKPRPHVRDHEAEHGTRGRTRSRREPRRPYAREVTHLRSPQLGSDAALVASVKVTLGDPYQGHRGQAVTELFESDGGLDTDQIVPDDLGDGLEGYTSDEDASLTYEALPEKVTDPKFDFSIHLTLENDSDIVANSQHESTDVESDDSNEFDDNHNGDNSDYDSDDASNLDSDLDSDFESELEPDLVPDHGSDHDPDVDSDLESGPASIAASQDDLSAELDPLEATLGAGITSPDASTSKLPLIPEGYGFTPHQDFHRGDIVRVRYSHCEDCPMEGKKLKKRLKWHRNKDKRHRGEGHYLVIYEITEDDGGVYANGFTCTSLRQRGGLKPEVVRDKFIRLRGGKDNFRPTIRDGEGNLSGEPAELFLEDGARMEVETYVEKKPKSFWPSELEDFQFKHETVPVRHRLEAQSLGLLLERTIRSRKPYCGRPRSRDR